MSAWFVLATIGLLALALAWYLLYVTGGLERYFWHAALSFLLFGDVQAHHAAVVAAKLIAFRRSRANIISALATIGDAPDGLMLLLRAAGRSSHGESSNDEVRKRGLQLAMSISLATDDVARLRQNLRSVAPMYATALSVMNPRIDVFSSLDSAAVKKVHTFFT